MPKTQQEIQATKSQWERPLHEVAWALTSLATISSSQVSNRLVTLSEAIGGDDLEKRSQAFAQLNEIFANEPDLAKDIANHALPLGDFYAHMVVLNDCLDAGLDLDTFAKILLDHKQAYDRKMGKQDAEPIAPEVPVTKKTNDALEAARSEWGEDLDLMRILMGRAFMTEHDQEMFAAHHRDLDDINEARLLAETVSDKLLRDQTYRELAANEYDVDPPLFHALHKLDDHFGGFDFDQLGALMPDEKARYDRYLAKQKRSEEKNKEDVEDLPNLNINEIVNADPNDMRIHDEAPLPEAKKVDEAKLIQDLTNVVNEHDAAKLWLRGHDSYDKVGEHLGALSTGISRLNKILTQNNGRSAKDMKDRMTSIQAAIDHVNTALDSLEKASKTYIDHKHADGQWNDDVEQVTNERAKKRIKAVLHAQELIEPMRALMTAKAAAYEQEIKDRAEREKNAAKETAQKKAEERRKLEAKSVSFEKKIADAQAQMQKSETLTEEQRKEACATIVTAHTIMKRYNSERPLVSESVFEKKYKQSIMGSNSFKELMTYPPEKLAKLATEKNGVGLHGAMLEIARKNEKQKQANANNGRSSNTLGKTEPQPGMGMGGKKNK